jgi:hypothetical protein
LKEEEEEDIEDDWGREVEETTEEELKEEEVEIDAIGREQALGGNGDSERGESLSMSISTSS